MEDRSGPLSSKSIRLGLTLALIAMVATGIVAWFQAEHERNQGIEDLSRRALLLGHRVTGAARDALAQDRDGSSVDLGDLFDGHLRLLGIALYRSDGTLVVAGQGLESLGPELVGPVRRALATKGDHAEIVRDSEGSTHVQARPLLDDNGDPVGAIAILHDALYIEDRTTRGVLRSVLLAAGIAVAMFFVTTGLVWNTFERPMQRLADWMRRLRFGGASEQPPRGLPVRNLADESVHLAASFRAARTREREGAQEIVRSDRAWTRDRLRAHAIDALGDRTLVVVSNREPYMHQLRGGVPTMVQPASGLVTGLDPVLKATGGIWVAHGAGDADRLTVDSQGRIAVPPDDARYTLRRVWISKEEEQGYYYGFSNEGLWPLCHLTHERPTFRASDWEQYVRANRRFADATLEEIGNEKAVVLVQDYQLSLVPRMLKDARPDLRVGLFWHIPWPNAEAVRICPYRVELLHGLLGADLLGFHLQQHCNNFLESVDRMVEARLDWDRFSAEIRGHTSLVRPFPISVQPWRERGVSSGRPLATQIATLRHQHQLASGIVGVGVDRIDYTKGIAERFRALDRLFERHPEHRGQFTFVQLGAPSRVHIPRYRDLVSELEALADEINWKHQSDGWRPIHFLVGHHDGATVYAFLKMASVCVVSSLHDGMNLVAKEFIAAKCEGELEDVAAAQDGVLVLSEFAGAARDLPEALVINPYDTEEFAGAIHQAIMMPERERRQRLTRLRVRVEENNIYKWAAELLTALGQDPGRSAVPFHPGATSGTDRG